LRTIRQSFKQLGLTEEGLRQRIRRGQIPYVRLGNGHGRIYVVPEQVRAFLLAQTRQPTPIGPQNADGQAP
jgi:hypothetical protein